MTRGRERRLHSSMARLLAALAHVLSVVAELLRIGEDHKKTVVPVEDQIAKRGRGGPPK
jgi:hypothetical protein